VDGDGGFGVGADAVLNPFLRLLQDLERYAPLPPGNRPSEALPLQSASVYPCQVQSEPVAEMIETDSMVYVTVELPGTGRGSIDLRATPRGLEIRATAGERRYDLRLALPEAIQVESLRATERNGVLDVALEKDRGRKRSGTAGDP